MEVDTDKLAYGLRRGIGHTNSIFASLPERQRLRETACGLVSSAIHQYCRRQEVPSSLAIATPDLSFDQKRRMQHVLPLIGEGDDRIIVDASYSQFFGYLGLHSFHKEAWAFPKEEIFHFKVTEEQLAVNWLTSEAVRIQKQLRRNHPNSDDMRRKPLIAATTQQISSTYAEIYKLSRYEPWDPPPHVINDGEIVARYIPKGAITNTEENA